MMKKTKQHRISREDVASGDQMIKDLEHLLCVVRSGKRIDQVFTVRTVAVREPRSFSPAQVRKLRLKLGLSQAVFCDVVGVSKKLVEHWESGIRKPSKMACRLLETLDRDPSLFLDRSIKRPAA